MGHCVGQGSYDTLAEQDDEVDGIYSLRDPDGTTVEGDLDLGCCGRLTSLPEGLTVGGNLHLGGASLTSLPEGLVVG